MIKIMNKEIRTARMSDHTVILPILVDPEMVEQVAKLFKQGRDIPDDALFDELHTDLEAELETARVFKDLDDK